MLQLLNENDQAAYNAVVAGCKATGDKAIGAITKTSKSSEGNNFEVGDRIYFPSPLQAFETKIGNSSYSAYYYLVKVVNSGNVTFKKFFPNSLGKRIRLVKLDDSGQVVDPMKVEFVGARGTAADEYGKHVGQRICDFFEQMVSEHGGIFVSGKEAIHTYHYGTSDIEPASLYTWDWFEEEAPVEEKPTTSRRGNAR
jgi:hypothetical protein